jgi:hypothetical protein
VAGELALPESGVAGFIERAAVLAAIVPLLYATRFFRPGEVAAAKRLITRPVAASG